MSNYAGKVKIYQPIKNPMQSGKNKDYWLVEHEKSDSQFVEPLMGWTGSNNTKTELSLKFDNKKDAVLYAKRKNYEYTIIEPNIKKRHSQTYADNFTS